MFNVMYGAPDGDRFYLQESVPSRDDAEAFCKKFHALYVGQPYPNGKGFYPFEKPRVVRIS